MMSTSEDQTGTTYQEDPDGHEDDVELTEPPRRCSGLDLNTEFAAADPRADRENRSVSLIEWCRPFALHRGAMTWFGWSIVELAEHLGYRPHASEGRGSRNRSYTKTVTTDVGPVETDMPRDRSETFEPVTVPKHVCRLEVTGT
jgi:Transposase, Mutator family